MVIKAIKTILSKTAKKRNKNSATPPKRGPGRPPKSATAKPKATGVTKKQAPKATGVTKKAPAKPSAKAKPVPAKTPTTKQKIGAAALTGGVLVGGMAGKKEGQASKSGAQNRDKMSFNEAFKSARKELGTDKTFTWRGKKYSTVTMDEVKKAGFDTLAEYNRSKSKKPTTGGTKNMKKGGYAKMKDGGSVKKMKKGGYAKMKDGGMASCGGRAYRQARQKGG